MPADQSLQIAAREYVCLDVIKHVQAAATALSELDDDDLADAVTFAAVANAPTDTDENLSQEKIELLRQLVLDAMLLIETLPLLLAGNAEIKPIQVADWNIRMSKQGRLYNDQHKDDGQQFKIRLLPFSNPDLDAELACKLAVKLRGGEGDEVPSVKENEGCATE